MPSPRVTRSKTGCQTCRRRKVRCDEGKPVCGACDRLELACSFRPGVLVGAVEMSRFRVRFVNSPYNATQRPGNVRTSSSSGSAEAGASSPASPQPKRRTEALDEQARPASTVPIVEDRSCRSPTDRDFTTTEVVAADPTPSCLPHFSAPADTGYGPAAFVPDVQIVAGGAHAHQSNVPVFFNLDMNFDFLGDWPAVPVTPLEHIPLSNAAALPPLLPLADQSDAMEFDASSPEASAVVIACDDHGLIQHYLNVMTQYTKVRGSGDENIYTQIFSNMALFFAPLYNAIMAWTALHLGQTRMEPDKVRKAELRYAHAVSLLHQDQDVASHFELSLVTIWFALQFELLAARGINSFCRHLEFTADLVDAHRRHRKAGGTAAPLGNIGARVLVWLGTYDARASWIGGTGRLLQNIELFYAEHDFLDLAFLGTPSAAAAATVPALETTTASSPNALVDLKPFLRLTVQLDTVEGRIVQLHRRQTVPPAGIWMAAQADLLVVQEQLERHSAVEPILTAMFGGAGAGAGAGHVAPPTARSGPATAKITTVCFNYLLLLAACYGLIISFHRTMPADAYGHGHGAASAPRRRLITAETAATRIVRIASWVARLRPPSPQTIWPRILFMAGIETTDLVYQDWVIKQFAEAELWGVNFGKTRLLLEHVIRRQSREGVRIDYREVMRQTTGMFII